jgi:hypothetical protein
MMMNPVKLPDFNPEARNKKSAVDATRELIRSKRRWPDTGASERPRTGGDDLPGMFPSQVAIPAKDF